MRRAGRPTAEPAGDAAPAAQIVLIGSHEARTDLGREFGATEVVSERGPGAAERVRELAGGDGTGTVLDCVGTMEVLQTAFGAVGDGGVISRASRRVAVHRPSGPVAVLGEVGAGVQVSPNASRVLHRLGLAEELATTGVKPVAWHQRRWDDGRTLLRSPLAEPLEATFGLPHYQMHRADLLAALAGAVPAERVHLGHRLTGLTDRGDRVEARFANGASVEVDVLVGADGIKSAVRGLLFGPEHPRFTSCVAYRGLVPAERLTDLQLEVTAQVWMGPGRHFVHYFVSGGRLVNFVAIIEQDTWTRESWTDRGDIAGALKAFEGWHPQVRTILASVDETFIWALFDRVPLRRWSAGRVTLLGDACHAMLPFFAQGAAQAIEDGAALAACLAETGPDLAAALRRYETVRLPRATRLQAMSTANKTRFHLPDGPEQQERDAQMAAGSTDWSFDAVAWLYNHDATVVDPLPDSAVTQPQSAASPGM